MSWHTTPLWLGYIQGRDHPSLLPPTHPESAFALNLSKSSGQLVPSVKLRGAKPLNYVAPSRGAKQLLRGKCLLWFENKFERELYHRPSSSSFLALTPLLLPSLPRLSSAPLFRASLPRLVLLQYVMVLLFGSSSCTALLEHKRHSTGFVLQTRVWLVWSETSLNI